MVTAKRELFSEDEILENAEFKDYTVVKERPTMASYYRDYDSFEDSAVDNRYDISFENNRLSSRVLPAEDFEQISRGYRSDSLEKAAVVVDKNAVGEETLYPTAATMRTLRAYQNEESEAKHKIKLNTRGKSIVAAYALVLVTLIVVVIINAVAISLLGSTASGLERNLNAVTSELNSKNAELGSVSNPSAGDISSDFVKPSADDIVSTTVPELLPPSSNAGSTNWFDALCDFLSGVFGG